MTTTEIPGYVTGKWTIDTAHSDIAYTVKHLGLAKSRGNFTAFSGTVVTEPNILDSSVTVEIDAGSVASGVDDRDTHLRSADFFHVEEHPTITFTSKAIREDDGDYRIDGELTWRGKTIPVTLDAEFNGIGPNPAKDNATTIGVSATATVNRRDFGIGPEGNAFLSEKVKIEIELQANLDA